MFYRLIPEILPFRRRKNLFFSVLEWFFCIVKSSVAVVKRMRESAADRPAYLFSRQGLGVCLPEIVVIERDRTGPVGRAVVQQAAVHNALPVRAVQTESERMWGEIAVKVHRASVTLPAFEHGKARL